MKVLFISNLFPDTTEPIRGIYNARLLAHLARTCELRVISPRPTLPLIGAALRQPRAEDHHLQPEFPPAWYLPKMGSRWNHSWMAYCLRGPVERVRREFPFDVVLAAWVYPDGCAVARLAARLKFPFAVIAQGTDVHQYLRDPVRHRIIVSKLHRAAAVITRSEELARLLREAGVPAGKFRTIYNGVDFDVFQPGDARAARRELDLPDDDAIVLYVGNLLPIKNPLLLTAAFAELTKTLSGRTRLVMIGKGPLLAEVQRQANAGGFGDRVLLPGQKTPTQVARYLQAADVLCIPSDDEGLPNVMLEAFATGLPVVATQVGGIPEVLRADYLGCLVERRNTMQLAEALARVLTQPRRKEEIIHSAQTFSWPRTAASYFELLQRVAKETTQPG